jgi:Mce-associated membrane protein
MATTAATPAGKLMTPDVDRVDDSTDLEDPEKERDSNWEAPSGDELDPAGTAEETRAGSTPKTAARWLLVTGLVVLVVLAALVGWLSYRAHQSSAAQHQRELFVQVGRQGAVNLTILDTATGSFHDDFASRSQPFIDVVKQSKSTTVGTITEAGVESESGDSAQILVAVTVKTSNAAAPEQELRSWRMRVGVQKVGADVKVANVEFVP